MLIDNIELIPTQKELDLFLDPFKNVREEIDNVIFLQGLGKEVKDKCKILLNIIEGERYEKV